MSRFLNFYLLFSAHCLARVTAIYDLNTTACQQLSLHGNGTTFSPFQSQYTSLSTENWSQTAWKTPTCVVQPAEQSELRTVVEILTRTDTHFAIRSGGHSPSPFASNINNGVLIDMSNFREIRYDPAQKTVTVGTGNRWEDVYHHLDQYNLTIVGGRVLDVGVGGLTLGGGLSYLSDLYGLVVDNVIKFEVVLANGSCVEASADAHQDLHAALKGTSNNFGIVTAFTWSTYPIPRVWGGIKSYSLEQLPALFSAAYEYQSIAEKDPYANFMLQAFTTNASIGGVLNLVYLKPEPSAQAFAPFYPIPTTEDTTKLQTLTQMMSGQRVPTIPRWDWFAVTFKPDAALYQKIANIVMTAPERQVITSAQAGTLALGLQPISSSVVSAGRALGGNALGLENVNQTWFVLDVGWWSADDDEMIHNATKAIRDRIAGEARKEGLELEYLFMNDASYDQDVIGHYGKESVEFLRKVQGTYDPDLVFQRLVDGGFKIHAPDKTY